MSYDSREIHKTWRNLPPAESSGTVTNMLVEDAPVEQPRKKIKYDRDVITVEDVVFNGHENLPAPWLSLNHIDNKAWNI